MANVNFGSVFTALNNAKSKENLTLHHMGKNVVSELTGIKFEICRVTFSKRFLPLKNFGMVFRFSRNRRFTTCTLR